MSGSRAKMLRRLAREMSLIPAQVPLLHKSLKAQWKRLQGDERQAWLDYVQAHVHELRANFGANMRGLLA